MADIIPIRQPPSEPPQAKGKRRRKPVERFSRVEHMLSEHQRSVYEACAVLGTLASQLHNGLVPFNEDQRVKTVYTLDAALRLLTAVSCIDSFADLVQQDEERRLARKRNIDWK